MRAIVHETPAEYEREYQLIQGTLVSRGTSFSAWLAERGINRQLATKALKGQCHGKKARALRAVILREVLSTAQAA